MKSFKVLCALSFVVPLMQAKMPTKRCQPTVDLGKGASVSTDEKSKLGSSGGVSMRKKRYEKAFMKAFEVISRDFSSILKEYENLKKAAPAEYAFYLNQLTSTIIEEVEEGRVHAYCGNAGKEFFHVLTMDSYQMSKERHQGPLKRFKNQFLVQAIDWLEVGKRNAKGTSIDAQADELIATLKGLKKTLQSAR